MTSFGWKRKIKVPSKPDDLGKQINITFKSAPAALAWLITRRGGGVRGGLHFSESLTTYNLVTVFIDYFYYIRSIRFRFE